MAVIGEKNEKRDDSNLFVFVGIHGCGFASFPFHFYLRKVDGKGG
jgi:hypothetical protein